MNDPRPQSTREQAEAAEWFARLGHRSVTTQTIRDFQDWRDNPDHDAAYAEVEAFWEANGAHAGDPGIMRMTEEALARRRGLRLPAWLRRPRTGWSLALASVAVAVGALLTVNHVSPTYSTEPTEQRVIRLADGSRVHLNVASKVRVQFRGGERRIVLARGEAFFDVAHDASRPFIVDAGRAEVRALGTKFDVRRDHGRVQVTLVEGVVRVKPDADSEAWTLAPNQQLTLARGAATKRALADAAPATSWTTGRLTFHATPLAAAVAEVNRYSDRKIDIEDADLAERLVSGVFDVGDTESFVKGVSMLFDLRATTAPDGSIRLSSDPPVTGA
jgi:transmembrane sensor